MSIAIISFSLLLICYTVFSAPTQSPIPIISHDPSVRIQEIDSPRITNWGQWYNFESCPQNTVVIGMQLKAEPPQGSGDDTALNGIRLFCGVPGQTQTFSVITSAIGPWGDWRQQQFCPGNSYASGFQLRSEPSQGTFTDDSAANNLNLYCSDGTMLNGDGESWGYWTQSQYCQSGLAVCGIQTQVEMHDPVDNTALNNVDMFCC